MGAVDLSRCQQLKQKLQGSLDKTYLHYRSWRTSQKGGFRQKINLKMQSGRYEIKTAESLDELQDVLNLRYKVFYLEGLKRKRSLKVDLDDYDFLADHLIVREIETNKVIGTYRLISSQFSNRFYSQSEFELTDLLSRPGKKLELGRACIDQSHRSGIAIALLWRGLRKYMELDQTRYMFGCGSIKTVDTKKICSVYRYLLENDHFRSDIKIQAQADYKIEGLEEQKNNSQAISAEEAKRVVPTLLRSYFKAGAKLVGEPALDRDFECVDFLVLLDTSELDESYDRRFSS